MKGCVSCGDVDISPCPPAIPAEPIKYKKCNPCNKIACKNKLDLSCVIFKHNQNNCGEGLPYLNIQNGTNGEDIVERIDKEFDKITKPTLLNCFVQKSEINPSTYRLNDVLSKLQEGYCRQIDLTDASITNILIAIRDTPELKQLFCEIVASC